MRTAKALGKFVALWLLMSVTLTLVLYIIVSVRAGNWRGFPIGWGELAVPFLGVASYYGLKRLRSLSVLSPTWFVICLAVDILLAAYVMVQLGATFPTMATFVISFVPTAIYAASPIVLFAIAGFARPR